LKTHSKTQKKSADLVSNKLRIGVFQRYQMKCKSVSKKSPRYTTRAGSIIQSPHETTVTAVEKPECTLHCKHFRDEVKMN
ncbi:hypothetical protein KX424_08525, partial [Escherichia coli]|nr:hypothetical protein [Escherichia coli]